MNDRQVVIIGAGPYGLSAATHLRAKGMDVAVFGDVMSFWREMPQGMLLRSAWDGSHISDPEGRWSLDNYDRAIGGTLPDQLDMTQFTDYGRWFQQGAVPDVDPRFVTAVRQVSGGFEIILSDGSRFRAGEVVVATGLTGMASMPVPYNTLPESKVSHASQERGLARHRGKRVAVIGSGQSALETSALLNEGGAASIEVITRAKQIYWLGGPGKISRKTSTVGKILYPPGAVGPLGVNWIVQLPTVYRALPGGTQEKVFKRALRPAGSGWIRPRIEGARFTTGVTAVSADAQGDVVRLTLSDGSVREVDHVLLGTGYKVNVDRYGFLDREIAGSLRRIDTQPWLGSGFQSSIAGLYFLGAPSDLTYGPLMRFVAGAGYAAKSVAREVASHKRPTLVSKPATGFAPSTASAD